MRKRLLRLGNSFRYAINGLRLLGTEPNVRVHALATVLVLFGGWVWELSALRWALLLFAIAGVWIAEALNTALERLCNAVSSEHHPLIGQAKDIGAAAVLLAAILAVIIGIVVFFC